MIAGCSVIVAMKRNLVLATSLVHRRIVEKSDEDKS